MNLYKTLSGTIGKLVNYKKGTGGGCFKLELVFLGEQPIFHLGVHAFLTCDVEEINFREGKLPLIIFKTDNFHEEN